MFTPRSQGQTTLRTIPAPEKATTVKQAVFYLLDWDEEIRASILTFEQNALWRLTHRVSATLGRKINPATVDRRVREYKNGR